MSIEIKRSKKPINYTYAINILEKKVNKIINEKNENELIWFLEHPYIFTAGSKFSSSEIIDNKIKLIKTNRGGKITWHGPGQLVCYFVIDLRKRKKDIRSFINIIENSIIETLKEYKIKAFADKKNIGIWCQDKNKTKKIAAIGIRVKQWIAYHGFSINISNDLNPYKKIIPCGIKGKEVEKLSNLKRQNYINISKIIEKKLINLL